MADELQILDGSFKGVPIFINGGSLEGGRKTVVHSFPSMDTQSVEDLGLQPRRYSLDLIIRSDDYFGYRNRLLAALESDTPGELVHPLYGRITNAKAVNYSLNETFGAFGDATITASFEIDNSTGIPQTAGNTVTEVQTAQAAVASSVGADISTGFSVTAGFAGNFSDAVGKVSSLIETANSSTQFIGEAATDINQFSALIGDLSSQVNSLVTNPIALSDSILGLFESVNGLYASADATLKTVAGLFGFGDDDVPVQPTTAGLIEREANRSTINGGANALALSYAYLAATEATVDTAEDVDTLIDSLDAQFDAVLSSGASDDTKSAIVDQRALTLQVLDATRITSPQILDIEVVETTSSRLLAFDYYGSDDRGELLAQLNQAPDVDFMSGDLKVLTA